MMFSVLQNGQRVIPSGLDLVQRVLQSTSASEAPHLAEKLVISEGTVEVHVKHILGILRFRSRAQVAGWVARQGRA
jgi:non-specific serine/threonine protein kinase